jgi:ABC-type sugar transport system permease subunit/ABC-type glycerol-3-phosphate transport system substrate-binding protein
MFRNERGRMNRLGSTLVGLTAAGVLALVAAPAGAADVPAGRTKLVFWNLFTTGTSHETLTELVRRFNERSDTWYVEQSDIPYTQLHAKMLPAIAGGVPPDVAIFDRYQVASYAARGAFVDLSIPARRDGIVAEKFFQAPWEECLYDGKLYAVPYDTDVRVLYYNRAMFREAGLDPNRPPKTWRELREYSKRITKRRGADRLDKVGYIPIWGNVGVLYLYGWQKGGRFTSPDGRTVTLNDPKVVESLQWVKEFVDEYGLGGLMSLQSGFGADAQNPFITGKVAMVVWDVGAVDTILRYGADLDWSTARCPYPEDGVPATWSGGFSLVLPSGTPHAEGAWAFCKHILSDESQRYMATSSNKLPALKSASNDPFFQDSRFWRLAIEEMKISKYRPVSPAGAAFNNEMRAAVDEVVHGKLSPQEALDVATAESQKVLDRFYEKIEGRPVNWAIIGSAVGGALLLLVIARARYSVRRVKALSIHRRQALAGYLFAAPAIVGLALFTVGPIVMSGVYSMTRYEIIAPATWAGAENYTRLFGEDRYFLKALWTTAYYAVFSVPVNIAMALGLALLLNREIRGRALYRTCFYLPTVMPAVAGSLLWAWLFNGEYGLINVLGGYLGLPNIPWLTSEYCSKPAIIVMGMWGVGGGMIIFLAALQGVPRTLYEAAQIDGAGAWKKFRHVTLPMISPAMFFMVVMGLIRSLQVFTQAYLMTRGGPVNSTLFYVLYLYREAFENLHMGYASAMAWVLFLVILAITGLQFVLAKRWVYYEGAQR